MHTATLQASTTLSSDFTLPKNRSTGFGWYPSDYKAFSYLFPRKLRKIGFPSSAPFSGLLLPLKYTPWQIILNSRYNSLKQYLSVSIRFQDLLTLCHEFFSTFPHGTLRYRTQDIFRVGGWCPPNSCIISNIHYSRYSQSLPRFSYGAITLYGATFQKTLDSWVKVKSESYNTTFALYFYKEFSLLCSIFSRWYLWNLNWFIFL